MQLCVECVESYARGPKGLGRQSRRSRRSIDENLPELETAIRVCDMHCPICLEGLCDDKLQNLAVEINCGCLEDNLPRLWHAECYRGWISCIGKTQHESQTIHCPVCSRGVGSDPLSKLNGRILWAHSLGAGRILSLSECLFFFDWLCEGAKQEMATK